MILDTLVSLVQPWVVAFSPNSFCYRGSYFKSRDGWSRNFRVCCGGRVKNLGCHWWLWLEGVRVEGEGVAGIIWLCRAGMYRGGCCWWCSIAGFGWEVLCWEVAWRVSVGCELGCCWWCVNGMWLGGIARDVVGGVLWLGFFFVLSWVLHIRSSILCKFNQTMEKKHNFMPSKSWLNQQYTACSVSFNPNKLSSTVVGVVFIRMSK